MEGQASAENMFTHIRIRCVQKWRVQERCLWVKKVHQVGQKEKTSSLFAQMEAKRSTDNHGDCFSLGPVVKYNEGCKKTGRGEA